MNNSSQAINVEIISKRYLIKGKFFFLVKATQSLQLKVHSIMTVLIFNTSHIVWRQNLPLRETKKSLKPKYFKGVCFLLHFINLLTLRKSFQHILFRSLKFLFRAINKLANQLLLIRNNPEQNRVRLHIKGTERTSPNTFWRIQNFFPILKSRSKTYTVSYFCETHYLLKS